MLTEEQKTQLYADASASVRGRSHILFHNSPNDPLQRIAIGLHAGSYIRPHNHHVANKTECLFLIEGQVDLLLFDQQGVVIERIPMKPGTVTCYRELDAMQWHSLVVQSERALLIEIKAGPYIKNQPEEFAQWAPNEKDKFASAFEAWMKSAEVGQSFNMS